MRRLKPCPRRPGCVGSLETPGSKKMEPIPYAGPAEGALALLVEILEMRPRTRIVERDGGYLHAEAKSALLGFVDDVEFVIDPDPELIHFRSAARLGIRDFGVNRRRMEEIAEAFAQRRDMDLEQASRSREPRAQSSDRE